MKELKIIRLRLPLSKSKKNNLHKMDKVLLTGTIYTARDQAHKRIVEFIETGKELPFRLKDAAIFYAGPTPAKPNSVCGAIGPTTSSRMDRYTPILLDNGVKVLIGKGERSKEVRSSILKHNALYLVAVGGAAALLSKCIISCEVVCWEDLGTEAIHRLEVKDFPCYVSVI